MGGFLTGNQATQLLQVRQTQTPYDKMHAAIARGNENWESSYTKRIVQKLLHTPLDDKSAMSLVLVDAASLLRDYHDTNHEVYEARDAANAREQEAAEEIAELTETNEINVDTIQKQQKVIQELQATIKRILTIRRTK